MNSTITNPTARELELLANLEATLFKLAQATELIQSLGGPIEAINDYADACCVAPYLEQHDVFVVDVLKSVNINYDARDEEQGYDLNDDYNLPADSPCLEPLMP